MKQELWYWVIMLTSLVIIGVLMIKYLSACPHAWEKIKSYETIRKSDNTPIAIHTIHECVHCKKLKKTEIRL